MTSSHHYTSLSLRFEYDHIGKRGYLNRLRRVARKSLIHKKQLTRRNDPFICKEIFGRPRKLRLDKTRMKYLRY